MQTCPKCAHDNLDGVLVCEHCGKVLSSQALLTTRKMHRVFDLADATEFLAVNPHDVPDGKITFQLLESSESIVIEARNRIVIGRVSPHSILKPDVDLSPFDAFSKGVSSQHAAIHRVDGLFRISDLGSVNGTYLNREGLIAHDAYALHNGDILQLGQLALCVRF